MFLSDWSHPRDHIVGTRKGFAVHIWRFGVSRHSRDLFAIAAVAFSAAIWALIEVIIGKTELGVAVLTIAAGVIGWTYQSANTRFGVVDIFAAEIATLCRVAGVDDFIPKYVRLFQAQREFPKGEAPRDYLAVFNNNAKDLETLDGDVARYVTQFYVHMKALMDTLARGADPQINTQVALNVIYTAFLAFESARQALAVLTDSKREREEYILTGLLSEIPAYLLLYAEADNLDEPGRHKLRKGRIEERLPRYQTLMKGIDRSQPTLREPSYEYSRLILAMWRTRFPPQVIEVLAPPSPQDAGDTIPRGARVA